MSTLSSSLRLLTVAAAAVLATQAYAASKADPLGTRSTPPSTDVSNATVAAFIDVNLAGFQTFGDFGDPTNSEVFLAIAPGSSVTGYDYLNLQFTTSGTSWLSEFVLSVNNSDGSQYLDAAPSDIEDGGVFGPTAGSWATALGGQGGGSFTAADGVLWVTVYETYVDDGLNATVNAGTLRIYYNAPAPVPEPSTYGLMGLGLLGVAAAARRRRSH